MRQPLEVRQPRTIAEAGYRIAAEGARQYLATHLLTADAGLLNDLLTRHADAALQEGMTDARAALDCGMTQAALQTFGATMLLAGIAAAKEACNV